MTVVLSQPNIPARQSIDGWMRKRLHWCLMLPGVLLLLILASSQPIAAAEQPIVRMQLEPISLRSRTGGPIGLRIKLNYNRDQILEGDLKLKVYDGQPDFGTLRSTLRYEGIVLQGSDAIFNMLLPPLRDAMSKSFDIEAWFETETERIPLSSSVMIKNPPDTFSVMSNDFQQRSAVLCSTTSRTSLSRVNSTRGQLQNMLSPVRLLTTESQSELVYFPASRTGVSMPEDPLALCCYDIVLVTDGALSQLEPAQLEALVTWTKAGGSLCVAPTDSGVANHHLDFLRNVLPQDGNRLILTDDGYITFATGEAGICAAYTGLGRCVLLPHQPDPAAELSPDERAWVCEFLWKARGISYPKPGESFADAHRLRPPVPPTPDPGMTAFDQQDPMPYGKITPKSSAFGKMCQMILMPSDVRMVPTSVIVGLLVAYVLAVGPVDYILLGMLGIRRFTWIVFPLVTLVFTLLMVAVAHHYLGSNETGGRFTVTDVVDNGQPIRESTVTLQFVGSRRDSTTPMKSGLISSVNSETLTLNGRFPNDYSADRKIEQWSPELTRTFTLSPGSIPGLSFDWNDPGLVTTTNGRRQLQHALSHTDGIECINASVINLQDTHTLIGIALPRVDSSVDPDYQQYAYNQNLPPHLVPLTAQTGSRSGLKGLFRFFSQVSPGGAAPMEDLPILDYSNPDQWLLLILLKTDDGYHLIRKLYCLTDADGQ